MREGLIVQPVGSGDIACRIWPDVGSVEHFLDLLNFPDNALNVHQA